MTIKTLEYIHRLMLEDVQLAENSANLLRQAAIQAEETEADNLEFLQKEHTKAMKRLWEAQDYLKDFEAQEF